MAKEDLNKIFLSASIPYQERDKKFYDTADVMAIRDAVRALATVVIPRAHLVWGGHPAITPLISYVIQRMNADVKKHVTLYQSLAFEKFFPEDNFQFKNIELVKAESDTPSSLLSMRNAMIGSHNYVAGVFIGGMEGVLDEYEMFIKLHPKAMTLCVASTGAAAKILYERNIIANSRLVNDYAYMALFKDLLKDYL